MARQQRADAIERTDRPRRARRPAGRAARPPCSPPRSNGLGHGRTAPRMSAPASSRWRLPPNTTSASAISPRATGARPSTPSSPMPTMDSQRRGAAVWAASGLAGDMRHILILGGTSEARQLAGRLADRRDLKVTLSLAGRTAHPAAQPVPVRVGGFGGTEGLAAYLAEQRIDVLVDATHPYAATMAAHAAEAAARAKVPIVALRRKAWTAIAGDNWTEVEDIGGAVARAGRIAAPRVPRHRPEGGRRLRGRSAARLSDPQRRSGRAAARRAARGLHRGARALQRGRRARAAEAASHRMSSSPRTAAAKRPKARSPQRGRSASRSSCCAGRPCPTCPRSTRCRMRSPGSIMRRRPAAERGV